MLILMCIVNWLMFCVVVVFFFKQKTAYDMRISDWSSDVCSSDLFEGSFNITNGVMTTQDSYIDGPVAYASMKGNLDIAKQLYNVDLKISPHIKIGRASCRERVCQYV